MVESAYLIWKIRCSRVCEPGANFENQPFSSQEVRNRWQKTIDDRLELDCLMTSPKYEKKALSKDIVLETWKGVLHEEEELQMGLGVAGVGLMGKATPRKKKLKFSQLHWPHTPPNPKFRAQPSH